MDADALDSVIATRSVEPVYQPVVDLTTGEVVGFEALARGPADGPLHLPEALFGAARRAGRLEELDLLARQRAVQVAAGAGLAGEFALFVNVEPAALHGPLPDPDPAVFTLVDRGVTPIAEITERALTDDPAALLAYADWIHAHGWLLALDDVGANPDSLALMPFLRPDVIKLDLCLVQQRPDEAIAETMTAVTAHAERTGAWVLAEGIETAAHERTARSLGARLGQGFRYGRPGPLAPVGPPRHPMRFERVAAPSRPVRSPFSVVRDRGAPQRASKALLVEVSKLLERQASEMRHLAVVLAAFERAEHVSPATTARYTELADTAAFVVVLGTGVPPEPAPGVRGVALDPADPVAGEWDVVVVGPHFAAALVAQDLYEPRADPERLFDYVLTYDRDVVLDIARRLMARALPRPTRPAVPRGPS